MKVRFNIINLMKPDSLYNYGMRILSFSTKIKESEGMGWHRIGDSISYYQNQYKRDNFRFSRNHYTFTAAADVAAKYSQAGNVSYTTFLKGVQEHMIERVRIDPTGRTAEFLNVDGARGMVNLFNDPNLLKILQENKIDISVTP